jgi:phosphatidate cytidylyltransferase
MFKVRLLSGIVLVAAALLFIISGGYILFCVMLALSLIAAGELYKATGIRQKHVFGAMDIAGYTGIALYYLAVLLLPSALDLMAVVIGFFIIMFVYVFKYPEYTAFHTMSAVFGIIYCGVMLSFIYQTRMLDGGQYHVWLIFLSAWGCDTCAYCVGMLFGKHKMAPVLSPKKSVEGAIGGVSGAFLLGIIYALITDGPILTYAVICTVGAVISMVGDLTASAIKRNMDIKDYGKLIPGHGGILDRFDSIIFTAPMIYYLSYLLIG